jgi:hypothetical protein
MAESIFVPELSSPLSSLVEIVTPRWLFSLHMIYGLDSEDLRANADFDVMKRAAALANQVGFVLALKLGRLL